MQNMGQINCNWYLSLL